MTPTSPLLAALIDPQVAAGWSPQKWGLAVRDGRSSNLLATFASRINTHIPSDQIPVQAKGHFVASINRVAQRNNAVRWESRQICVSLATIGLTPIFLKGAAYVLAGLPLARHRHFADIDAMVHHNDLAAAETQLMLSGWLSSNNDAYDQHYYRRWMHEIPPLQHIHRGTTLDLHHAISPRSARYQAIMESMFASAIPAAELDGARVLCPTDMILHAAAHLFAEGETDNALRNLVDISELLKQFQREPNFDACLAARALEIGLARPLYYALRYLQRILNQDVLDELIETIAPSAPGQIALKFMDALYDQVFRSGLASCSDRNGRWPGTMLYLRGHWLRMPAHLLIPHLCRKLVKSTRKNQTS